jgi:hypothetical protein
MLVEIEEPMFGDGGCGLLTPQPRGLLSELYKGEKSFSFDAHGTSPDVRMGPEPP